MNVIIKILNLAIFIIFVIAFLIIIGLFMSGTFNDFALSGVNVIQGFPTYLKTYSGIAFFISSLIFLTATLLTAYKKHTNIYGAFKHFFESENKSPAIKLVFSISQLSILIYAVMSLLV